jgi:hypothetical protein
MVASTNVWGVVGMTQWHCCISYLIQVPIHTVYKHKVQKHIWSTSLIRISIDVAENFLLPLLFLRSVSILLCCPPINIRVGHQDMKLSWIGPMAYHPHIMFFYFKILKQLCIIAAPLAIFSAWICVGVGIGKFLFVCVLKTFSPWKVNILGGSFRLAGSLLHCVWVTDWIGWWVEMGM